MLRNVILILCFAATFTACQKDSTPTPDNPPASSSDTTILVKHFVVVDTTRPATSQLLYSYYFDYDATSRCTGIKGSDGIDSFVVYNYYNGSDTLIARRKSFTVGNGDSTLEYFTYNASGKMLLDSMLEYGSTTAKLTFDYRNATNTGGVIPVRSSGVPFEYNRFATTRSAGGNILNMKDSLFVLNSGLYTLTEASTANSTYDARPNPLYRTVPMFPVNALTESVQVITFLPFQSLPQQNNILTENRIFNPTSSGLDDVNASCQYEYKTNNYPTVVRIHDIINSAYYKGVYSY